MQMAVLLMCGVLNCGYIIAQLFYFANRLAGLRSATPNTQLHGHWGTKSSLRRRFAPLLLNKTPVVNQFVHFLVLNGDPFQPPKGQNIALIGIKIGPQGRLIFEPAQKTPFLVKLPQAFHDDPSGCLAVDQSGVEDPPVIVHRPDRFPFEIDHFLSEEVRPAEITIQVRERAFVKLQIVRKRAARRALLPPSHVGIGFGSDDKCLKLAFVRYFHPILLDQVYYSIRKGTLVERLGAALPGHHDDDLAAAGGDELHPNGVEASNWGRFCTVIDPASHLFPDQRL